MPSLFQEVYNSRRVHRLQENWSPSNGYSSSLVDLGGGASRDGLKDKVWVHTPNYRTLVLTNQPLPDNNFRYHAYEMTASGGAITRPQSTSTDGSWTKFSTIHQGSAGILYEANPVLSSLSRVELTNKLIQKAKGSEWNVPVFVAEGGKTIAMVVKSATQIVLMARALRKGDLKQFVDLAHPDTKAKVEDSVRRKSRRFNKNFAKDPETTFSSYWLQWKYGWTPFMSDVRNSVNTLMDSVDKPANRVGSVYASIRNEERRVRDNLLVVSESGNAIYSNCTITEKLSQRATWRFTSRAEDLPGRFGLLNPLLIAWELVPLSFVVDWFVPVGNYLSSLDTPQRFNHLGGSWGAAVVKTIDCVPVRCEPSGATFTGFNGGLKSKEVRRDPMLGIPEIRLSDLSWNPNLSVAKMVTSLALLHTFFGKR